MKGGPTLRLRVANQSVDIPILGDEDTTRRIAKQVDERMAAIEEELGRVNSQTNAVQAACEYAFAAMTARAETKQDQEELAVALERIATRLRRLAEEAADA